MKKITDPKQKKKISIKIKAVEEALNITGKELARLCGVSDTTIYRIDGRTKSDAAISEKTLAIIAEKTGVNIGWLLDYDSVESGESDVSPLIPIWSRNIRTTESEENPETNAVMSGGSDRTNSADESTTGKRVKTVRSKMRMSQVEFAKLTGMSSGNLAGIEKDRNRLTEQTANRIEAGCLRFGYGHAGAEWLLTGDEQNKDYPIGFVMIEWLKNHKEARKKIWDWMRENDEDA